MGILRNLLYGLIIALWYSLGMIVAWRFNAGYIPAYVIIGISFSFFGWGAERLWLATLQKFFNEPSSLPAMLTRFPVWGLFGGMAYTLALLVSKKYFWFYFEDVPIKDEYFTGAIIGCIIQLSLYLFDIQGKKVLRRTLTRLKYRMPAS